MNEARRRAAHPATEAGFARSFSSGHSGKPRYAVRSPTSSVAPALSRPLSEGSDTMTTISANSDLLTLINMFTVEPANQRRLVELLTKATEVSVRRAPGFVSASLHRSTDGTKVTMYAQWRSIDDYQAMRQDLPRFRFFRKRSRSPSLNPASTRSCEPSHPPASRIEATTVLSAWRQKPAFP